jgi:hypothetical protein
MSPEEPSTIHCMDTQNVRSRSDLVRFLANLSAEVEGGRVTVEPASIADLLDGATRWVADMDGFFLNRGEEPPSSPTSELIAMVFAASLVYE